MTQPVDDAAAWQCLAAAWADERPWVDVHSLHARVQRESTNMRRWLAVELAFSLAVVALTIVILVRQPGSRALLVAVDSWVVLVTVWVFALWGRRGLWRPSSVSTTGFVELSRRRAQLRLRTAWFAFALLAAQLVVAQATSARSTATHWLVAAVWLAWALWLRRRATRECRRFDALLAELHGG